LGIPWLAAYNPEINWETGESKDDQMPTLMWPNTREESTEKEAVYKGG